METTTRPRALDQLVGQRELAARLRIVMAGARLREVRAPHVLLSGPPGTGKTTLSRIVAAELGARLVTTTGPALRRPADLVGILLAEREEDETVRVLFIDEIHRLSSIVEETLYEVLEDGCVTCTVGSSSDARAVTLKIPPTVVVAATTRPGMVSSPLRDRFGFQASMAPYTVDELSEIVGREWARQGHEYDPAGAREVATRSKGVPRIALHLAARVLDVCAIEKTPLDAEHAVRALSAFGVSEDGLDETDWLILEALCGRFAGRAVGVDALAQALSLDRDTIEREHEGNLVRAGLVTRTHNGRMATPAAYSRVQRGR